MTDTPPSTPPAAWLRRHWTMIALSAVIAGYLLQLASPLRLNHDAVRLLSLARTAHANGSLVAHGVAEQFPPGYPAMVSLLLTAGLGRTLWINLLNLAWLGAALVGWYWIARRQTGLTAATARLSVALPLLSWVVIKHAVLPLTDLPYLGLSTFSLLFLQRFWSATERLSWRDLVPTLGFAIAAMQLRTIGVALIAATAASAMAHPLIRRITPIRLVLTPPGLLLTGSLATIAGLLLTRLGRAPGGFAAPNTYLGNLFAFLGGESPVTPGEVLIYRLSEIATLGLNLPFPRRYDLPLAVVGLIMLGALLAAARPWWATHRPWLFYGGAYAAILLLWHFSNARFLLPLVPVISLLAVTAGIRFAAGSRTRRQLTGGYAGLFALLGLLALGYSTRLSLAGSSFARLYGLADTRATYAHAFGLKPENDAPPPHADWLELLHQFEPRAAATTPVSSRTP